MITSDQISALIGQQQQMLGMMGAGQPQSGFSPMSGASQYPPQFSYGIQQGGAGMASRTGGMMAGGAAAVPGALAGVGMAAGLGSIFSSSKALGAAAYLDPMNAPAMGVFRAGSSLMAGGSMGGAAAMAAPGMAIGAATYAGYKGMEFGAQNFAEGFRQQNAIGAQTAGMQFMNPMAQGGRGMDPRGMQQIGNVMRKIDRDDPFTSMRDVSQTMGQFTDMGMAQGVRDAEEFAGKFKKMMETVKTMAKTMGTTVADAARVFGSMRQTGFYSSADVMGNTAQMRLGGALGMSQQSFLQTQQQGADFSRSLGVGGQAGARAMGNTQIAFAQEMQAGRMTEESLMDLTGASNREDAASSMAMKVTQGNAVFLKSAAGRALLAASGTKDKNGRFTGGIDTNLMGEAAAGGLTGLAAKGGARTATAGAKSSFVNEESEIMGAALGSEDINAMIMQTVDSTAGVGADDDVKALVYQRLTGQDKRTYEAIKKMVDQRGVAKGELKRKLAQSQMADAMSMEMTTNRTFSGIAQQVTGGMGDFAAAPFQAAGAQAQTSLSGNFQRAQDLAFGVSRYSLKDEDFADTQSRAIRGQAQMGGTAKLVEGLANSSFANKTGLQETAAGQALGRSAGRGERIGMEELNLTPEQRADATRRGQNIRGGMAGGLVGLAELSAETSLSDKLSKMSDSFVKGDALGVAKEGLKATAGFGAEMGLRGAAFALAGGDREKGTGIMLAMSQTLGRRAIKDSRGANVAAFATQEAAITDFKSKLVGAGMSEKDADAMARGGSGSSLLAKLGNRGDAMQMIARHVATAKETNDGEAAINTAVAKSLTRELGKAVSAAEVAEIRKITENLSTIAAADGHYKNANAVFRSLSKAAGTTQDTVALEEMATSAKSALEGISPELAAAGGASLQEFKAEISSGAGGAAAALAKGGSGSRLIENMSSKSEGELKGLMQKGGADSSIAEAALMRKRSAGKRDVAGLASALGLSKEDLKARGLKQGGFVSEEQAKSLVEETTLGKLSGVAAGGTGGITTTGDPTRDLMNDVQKLNESVKQTVEVSSMAYTAATGKSMPTILSPDGKKSPTETPKDAGGMLAWITG